MLRKWWPRPRGMSGRLRAWRLRRRTWRRRRARWRKSSPLSRRVFVLTSSSWWAARNEVAGGLPMGGSCFHGVRDLPGLLVAGLLCYHCCTHTALTHNACNSLLILFFFVVISCNITLYCILRSNMKNHEHYKICKFANYKDLFFSRPQPSQGGRRADLRARGSIAGSALRAEKLA